MESVSWMMVMISRRKSEAQEANNQNLQDWRDGVLMLMLTIGTTMKTLMTATKIKNIVSANRQAQPESQSTSQNHVKNVDHFVSPVRYNSS